MCRVTRVRYFQYIFLNPHSPQRKHCFRPPTTALHLKHYICPCLAAEKPHSLNLVAPPVLTLAHHVPCAEWLEKPSLTSTADSTDWAAPSASQMKRDLAVSRRFLWAFEGGNSRLTFHSMANRICRLVNLLIWGPLLSCAC